MFDFAESQLAKSSWCASTDSKRAVHKRKLAELEEEEEETRRRRKAERRKQSDDEDWSDDDESDTGMIERQSNPMVWEPRAMDSALTSLRFHSEDPNIFVSSSQSGVVDVWSIERDPYHNLQREWSLTTILKHRDVSPKQLNEDEQNFLQMEDDDDDNGDDKDVGYDSPDSDDLAEMTDAEFRAFLDRKKRECASSKSGDQTHQRLLFSQQGCSKKNPCIDSIWVNDGLWLVSGWKNGTLRVTDAMKQSTLIEFNHSSKSEQILDDSSIKGPKQGRQLTCLDFLTGNRKVLLSGDDEGLVNVWDLRDSNHRLLERRIPVQLAQTTEQSNVIRSSVLSMLNSRRRLVVSGDSAQLSVYDLRRCGIPSNSSSLSSSSASSSLRRAKSAPLFAKSDQCKSEMNSLCLSKFGKFVSAGTTGGEILLWKWDDWGMFCDSVNGHSLNTRVVRYDDDCLLTSCDDGTLRLISIMPHRLLHVVGSYRIGCSISACSLSCDRKTVVSYSSQDQIYGYDKHQHLRVSPMILAQRRRAGGVGLMKIHDLGWNPRFLKESKLQSIASGRSRIRVKNSMNLGKGLREFIELSDGELEGMAEDESLRKVAKCKRIKLDKIYVRSSKVEGSKKRDEDGDGDDYDGDSDDSFDEYDRMHHGPLVKRDSKKNKSTGVDSDSEEQWQGMDESLLERRLGYKSYQHRDDWLKHLKKARKIRAVTKKHNKKQAAKKFFRGLC